MGKYSHLKEKFDRWTPPPGEWADKVRLHQESYSGRTLEMLATNHLELRKEKQSLEDQLKEVNAMVEGLNAAVVERLETEGATSFKALGATFFLQDEPYCSTEDVQKLDAWATKDAPYLFRINWQSLNALVKDRLIQGLTVPDGVKVFIKTKLGSRS